MNTDERLGKLDAKVEHIQSDVTELKADTRQLREALHAQGKQLLEAINAQRNELIGLINAQRNELIGLINAQGKELVGLINAQGKELRAEISDLREQMHALVLGLEKFKWRFWAALTVLAVVQLLVAGGAPAAIVRALKLP